MKINNYICHVPYLRNSKAYNHDFWYTCVKWWYVQALFSFFWSFFFFGFLRGKRAKNCPKRKITITFLTSKAYDHDFWYTCVKWWYIQAFFFFFYIYFDFLGCYRGKRAKNSPKWQKNLSVGLDISGTIHHMIVICGTQV